MQDFGIEKMAHVLVPKGSINSQDGLNKNRVGGLMLTDFRT